MCGIFGIIGPRSPVDWRGDVLQNLLIHTEDRGEDASGIAFVNPETHSTVVLKDAVKGSDFAFSDPIQDLVDGGAPPIVIGHCRKKTQGHESNQQNNHPITSKTTGLALVHNGMVRDAPWRAKNDDGTNPFILDAFDGEVDSEAILRLIDTMRYIPRNADLSVTPEVVAKTPKNQWEPRVSLATAIDDALYNISGSQACALISPEEPNAVYVWRTASDKPLFLCFIPEYEVIVFASTKIIADKALESVDTKTVCGFFTYELKRDKPDYLGRELPVNTLLRIAWIPEVERESQDEPFSTHSITLDPGGAATNVDTLGLKKTFQANEAGVGVD